MMWTKTKKTTLFIIGFLFAFLMYLIYVADRIITSFSLQPKVGFKKWLHNPKLKIINPKWLGGEEIEHNLQVLAIIRIFVVLTIYLLSKWIF